MANLLYKRFPLNLRPFNSERIIGDNSIAPGFQTLISAPVSNSIYEVGQTINIKAEVTTEQGSSITKVDFIINGQTFQTDTTAPYTFDWIPTKVGIQTIRVVALDTSGKNSEAEATISVLDLSNKLIGSPIGTPDLLCRTGEGINTLFDGDFSTALNTKAETKHTAWAGLDFGEGKQKNIGIFQFAIRVPDNLNNVSLMKTRLEGAKIYGANNVTWDKTGQKNDVTADIEGNLLYEITASDLENANINQMVSVAVSPNSDKAYRYVLIFFSGDSHGNCSEFQVYSKNETLSTSSLNEADFNAYVSNGNLLIKSSKREQIDLKLYDVRGMLVLEKEITISKEITNFRLPNTLSKNNIYILKIQNSTSFLTKKILN